MIKLVSSGGHFEIQDGRHVGDWITCLYFLNRSLYKIHQLCQVSRFIYDLNNYGVWWSLNPSLYVHDCIHIRLYRVSLGNQ